MTFTRVSTTEAACTTTRGVSYRLLALATDGNGPWMVIPDVTPPQPTYYAIPGQPDVLGFEIRRGRTGGVVGYSENLADAAWPVEDDLIRRGVDLRAGSGS